ncbi:larval cuticle protein 65Ag1-like [Sitophilus oryzae]|uniref:Larval cuticle protein 65Ag1-like n=1 Tax=Sitophilus oryzae TaxID=7048 RepID=A0A6J2XRQ1_SITOR|nr:larval cuticle protein 65Ag1-like [Sitophilus oryzae]
MNLKYFVTCVMIFIIYHCSVKCEEYSTDILTRENHSYTFMYDTPNGIRQEETRTWNDNSTDSLTVVGSYEYASNGVVVKVTYVADKNGYRPKVRVLQKAELVPPAPMGVGYAVYVSTRLSPATLASLSGGGLG